MGINPIMTIAIAGAAACNILSSEAQVYVETANVSKLNIPTTICHEIAHQLGYSAENEANYISIEATLNSDNEYVNYSGSTFALKYLLNEIYLNDKKTYKELINKINIGVLKNYKEVSENWKRYKNPLEKYFKKSYDIYLKANNQTKGIKTYNLVVDLLVNEYVNSELQELLIVLNRYLKHQLL